MKNFSRSKGMPAASIHPPKQFAHAEIEGDLATEELYKEDVLGKASVTEQEIQEGMKQDRNHLTVRWLYARAGRRMLREAALACRRRSLRIHFWHRNCKTGYILATARWKRPISSLPARIRSSCMQSIRFTREHTRNPSLRMTVSTSSTSANGGIIPL